MQLTVDVADFNKTKVKSEEVYMNATRYIVSSSLYILFPYCLILALNDSSIGFSSYWECCLVSYKNSMNDCLANVRDGITMRR